MDVLFIASVAVITADPPRSRQLYMDALGLPLEGEGDGYYSSGNIAGSKHFGVWPLADAVAAAGEELQAAGYQLLHPARTEPWGQTVARLLSEDGLIVGISYAPVFHEEPA